jgi:hypothetical protein
MVAELAFFMMEWSMDRQLFVTHPAVTHATNTPALEMR